MDCSTPSFPIHHQLLELAQTNVHWVSDAIQPCHPLLSPYPPAFNLPSISVFSNKSVLHISGQSIGISASASVLPMKIQDWFPLDWLVSSPCSPKDSQESFPAPQFEGINSLESSLLYGPTLTSIHDYWKNHSFDYTFVSQVISLLFNTLSRLVIAFPARSKHLLISWYVYRYICMYTISESE